MKVKQDFLRFGTFKINNGSQVRFWEDTWLGSNALKFQYHGLYKITRKKHVTIGEFLTTTQSNTYWRRTLFGSRLVAWNELLSRIANIHLTQDEDAFYWTLSKSGQFSVKSHYQALIRREVPNLNKRLWNLKAPLKIKIFLWYLRRGVILTKDNLARRNWHENKTCCFCHEDETIQHLFFECRFARMTWALIHMAFRISKPFNVSNLFGTWLSGFDRNIRKIILLGAATTCWSLWLNRNDIVFEKKKNSSPLQVIHTIAHCLRTWAVLQKAELRPMVVEATQYLVRVAKDFFSGAHGWRSSLRIDYH